MSEEYHKYLESLKKKIAGLKKGSKAWWRLNRELLDKKAKCSSIPPLRDEKEWIDDSKGKANLFAKTFESQSKLPPEFVDCPFFGCPEMADDQFITLRSRYAKKFFKALQIDKATGPDRIPASILKALAAELALPFTILCRRLLHEACWPSI